MKRTIRALHPVDQSDTTFEKKQLLKIRQSLSKRLSCVLPLVEAQSSTKDHLEQLDIKAKNFVQKTRLINDPATTFTIANLIKQERGRASLIEGGFHSCNQSPKKDLFLPTLGAKKQGMNQKREEVFDLAKWLDSKLEVFRKKQRLELEDILEYKQGVINLALGELMRMVGNTCREQARLLKLIWDSTFQIFQKLITTLATLTDTKEKEYCKELLNQGATFENKLIQIDQGKISLRKQNEFLMDRFKQLIINYRRLKKDKKQLELKNRMTQYSLQSYQESYVVVLEMALQSTDSNILEWAKKIMSKLLRDKRRKRKNFIKAQVDKDVFRSSKEVVMNWLSRNVEDYKEQDFQIYNKENFDEVRVSKDATSFNRKDKTNGKNNASTTQNQRISKDKQQINEGQETLLSQMYNKNKDNLSSQSQDINKQDIYSYFRCYDIGTSMDITYCDVGVSNCPGQRNIILQTDLAKMVDCAVSAGHSIRSSDEQSNVAKHRKGVLMNDFDIAISETDNSISEIGTKSKSKYQYNKSKARKIHDMEDDAVSRYNKRHDRKQQPIKKNMVRVGHYYDDRGRQARKPFKRTKSSEIRRPQIIRPNIEVLNRGLELKKFSQIFDAEKMRMFKNIKSFVETIQRRRSFYRIQQVEYITNGGGELHAMQKKIVMNTKYRAIGILQDYSKISKKIRLMLQQNINVMRFRTYKLNQQIFNSIASDLKPIRIRDQKVLATYNALCKVFSSLIIDYVRMAKKEKEEGGSYRAQKFVYPLNVLYVDRFLHIFGLREIAERNIRNTIIQIISLADKLQRIRLFRELLGVADSNISGDELQIYIKCLVYFDNTGKVSINQASMKEFNIDKLSTDTQTVHQNLPTVCADLLCQNQIPRLTAQIQKITDQQITIEGVALMLIKANCQYKSKLVHEYMPLYQYIVSQGDLIHNFLYLTKICRIGLNSQIETIKLLVMNLDVAEDNIRTITPQRFLSSCLQLHFPTITQMSQFFWNQISKHSVEESLRNRLLQSEQFNLNQLNQIGSEWGISIPQPLISEITGSVENSVLSKFWRGMAIHLVLSTQLQNTIDRIIPQLITINAETYSIFFRKQK